MNDGDLLKTSRTEWPTLASVALCYSVWFASLFWVAPLYLPLGLLICALAITFHSSLQHEVIHGHPFENQMLSDALVFPALGLFIPYGRFRDLHLAHHKDAHLTDPYDDPETQYLDPKVWHSFSWPLQFLLKLNGSLAGRMVLGPAISQFVFVRDDLRLLRAGSKSVAKAWALHLLGAAPVLICVLQSAMPIWAYVLACYLGLSILRIRVYLEHQAHEHTGGRTVIIEDRGPLAFLFLNNNFHAVHHMKPGTPWYELPGLYFANRENFLERNLGYSYPSYRSVMGKYMFRAKEPVAHPHYK